MGSVVDGQHGSVHGRDADDTDHRPHGDFHPVAPVHHAVRDFHNSRVMTELLAANPVRKHADPGPERGEPEPDELHVQNFHGQHVARLRAADLDRPGGAVHERQGDVGGRQLLSDTSDDPVVDVDRGLDCEGLAGIDRRNKGVVAGKRVFDMTGLLRNVHRGLPSDAGFNRCSAKASTCARPCPRQTSGPARGRWWPPERRRLSV